MRPRGLEVRAFTYHELIRCDHFVDFEGAEALEEGGDGDSRIDAEALREVVVEETESLEAVEGSRQSMTFGR